MLVLARRAGESIVIGPDIEVTVVEIQGDKVKLGVSAPKQIPVLRRELIEAARSANAEAASPDVSLGSLRLPLAPGGAKPKP